MLALSVAVIAAPATRVAAGEPPLELPAVTVTPDAAGPATPGAPADSAAWTLAGTPGVLLNTQGSPSAQSDLSIRGSSFSGAGLSLGGLSLRNPQTEHFHTELPIPPALLTAPAVLTGLDQASRVDGHLVGTVSFDFLPLADRRLVEAGIGENSRNWQNLVYQASLLKSDPRVGAGIFGGREYADSLDYPDNDLDRIGGGLHLQAQDDGQQTDLAVSAQRKEFGARGYYGVTPDWAANEKIDDLLFFGSSRFGDPDGTHARVSAAWREIEDDYRLFWTLPGVYANRHESTVRSAFADGRQALTPSAGIRWRTGAEEEELDSSNLGNHHRTRGMLLLMPEWRAGRWHAAGGLQAEAFTGDSPALLPQAGAGVDLAPQQELYAAYTENVRQPSFTELNYDSPGSLGDQGLERQRDQGVELGLRGAAGDRADYRTAVFARRSRDAVDWVKETAASPRWVATDVGTVDLAGVEAEGGVRLAEPLALRGYYQWLRKELEIDPYAGRYVLDYPEHLAQLSARWRVRQGVQLSGAQTFRWQAENPVRSGGDLGTDGRIALDLSGLPWKNAAWTVAIDNVWDDDFQVLAGQPVAGRRLSGAVRMAW